MAGRHPKKPEKKFIPQKYSFTLEKRRDEEEIEEIQKRADELGISRSNYIKLCVLRDFEYSFYLYKHGAPKNEYLDNILHQMQSDGRRGVQKKKSDN